MLITWLSSQYKGTITRASWEHVQQTTKASIENELKCSFKVISDKLLGFIVRHRGIKVDLAKIEVIIELQPSKNLLEPKRLQACLMYSSWFITNLFGRCQLFSWLMNKDF